MLITRLEIWKNDTQNEAVYDIMDKVNNINTKSLWLENKVSQVHAFNREKLDFINWHLCFRPMLLLRNMIQYFVYLLKLNYIFL